MKKTRPRRPTPQLTDEKLQQWRRDRDLIAEELPDLMNKHRRIRAAAKERTTSGALRRAIHSSKILLHDLANRALTDLDSLDAFLTGDRPLTSDVIDRLTHILGLKLEANGRPKTRLARTR